MVETRVYKITADSSLLDEFEEIFSPSEKKDIMKIPRLNPKGEPWKIVYPTTESITKFFNELREDMATSPFWDKYRNNGRTKTEV